ncbi:DUF3040 domain-containing protein [Saccharopolyspora endophytica]|uniref:DUF3040 domain-containing protein n=1 Tax=Saccharopolyspora endophytica TaxID=543886 RepID=A0ABS5DLC7_9PSEU|nr:DUF3040 domain-containing protein [Saccharopolyspora endophytica]MBQ0927100.1 DUF3040 domain-containing protein [Saccharopolyspora endophytica]
MLSRDERRRLREIEDWFVSDDPAFAERVATGPMPSSTQRRFLRTLIATGIVIVVFGIVLAVPALIFLGLACTLGATALSVWRRQDESRDGHERDH